LTRIKSHAWLTALVLSLAVTGLIIAYKVHANTQLGQDAERALDILRYPNQPLELVELKIGQNSVKKGIKFKSKDNGSQWEKYNVKFKERENWFKHVQVRLRNTSGRPVYSLSVSIFFLVNSPSLRMAFELPLKAMETRDLKQQALQPGEEINLAVTESSFNDAMGKTKQYGVDANQVQPFLSVEQVLFSDDIMWRKGTLMQRDPGNANSWKAVGARALGASLSRPTGFTLISYKGGSYAPQGGNTRCQQQLDHSEGTPCSDNCGSTWYDMGNGTPGNLSQFPLPGKCLTTPSEGGECNLNTTHYLFAGDTTCPPTPCPDGDGDGYSDAACGGDDCEDGDPLINPGATEMCRDGIDNNCDGSTDCEDFNCAQTNTCAGCNPSSWQYHWCTEYAGGTPNPVTCQCEGTPISIDVLGNGFDLTDAQGGVNFDLNSDGILEKLSWTTPGSDDAWLTLDRNGNGKIDNGTEMFGNFTAQPTPPAGTSRNGFLALAEYDKPVNGGNGDGVIDSQDTIFPKLRLWQDINHNGISEANELGTLPSLDVVRLHLDYKESKRTDRNGNLFRYRAQVEDTKKTKVGRWAWDIFLVSEQKAPAQLKVLSDSLFQLWVLSLRNIQGVSLTQTLR
jgi:hypothetical protein